MSFYRDDKNGKKYYAYNSKKLTNKEIVVDLNKKRKVKHNKKLKCYYSKAIVNFKGDEIKLFFCRYSKRAKWNGLLTTNIALHFEDASRIYSKRWMIEVFLKECKQYLGLGKCHSQDFDAQIASTSIYLIQSLCCDKRFEGYKTIGELFRTVQADTLELTVCERI